MSNETKKERLIESLGVPKMQIIAEPTKTAKNSVTIPPMQATPIISQNTNGNNGNNQKGK